MSIHGPRTFFITGASSGIGLALTRTAAARGDNVVAVARDVAVLSRLAEEHGSRVLPAPPTSGGKPRSRPPWRRRSPGSARSTASRSRLWSRGRPRPRSGRTSKVADRTIRDHDQTLREVAKATADLPASAFDSPDRVAAAILVAVDAEHPPLRLATGSNGLEQMRSALQSRLDEYEAWRAASEAVDAMPAAA